jgi:signal transduction histidine kinase
VSANSEFLNQKELAYLKEKKYITMCVDPNWMPLEMIEEREHIGVGADFIDEIRRKINTPISLVQTKSWTETLSKARKRECDIISMAEKTPDREEYLNFTAPYVETPLVVIRKTGEPFVNDLNEIKHKSLGVVKNYSISELLREKYKGINLIEVESIQDGLKQVRKEKLYGFLDNPIVINHEVQKNGYKDIAINGQFEDSIKLSIAIRDDEPMLYEILNKAVLSVDKSKKKEIVDEWKNIKYKKTLDYKLIAEILFFVVVAIGALTYWSLRLKDEIDKKEEARARLNRKSKELESAKKKLEQLNSTLEQRVKDEIDKNLKQQVILLQQNRLAQMGEMIQNIAHQWRQPLAQINSCVLLLDSKFDRKKLDEIESLTSYMSKTIDDFKNFFSPDKKKEELYIYNSVQNAYNILKGALGAERIVTKNSVDKNIKVDAYAQELEHVFIIILNNAKDALLHIDSKREIVISSHEEDDFLKIVFCDNGGGIKDEHIDKIYEPYFSTKHKAQGTGLGLYMAKMIIEDGLGGRLIAYNEGNRACFEISLPKKGSSSDS